MPKTNDSPIGKIWVYAIAALMFLRGIIILFSGDNTNEWSNLLGTGGLANAQAQAGWLGWLIHVAWLIEGRFWIIAAFPLVFRLAWGRDVVILVAGLGIALQIYRLFNSNVFSSIIWLLLYILIALAFWFEPKIKAYFIQPQQSQNEVKPLT